MGSRGQPESRRCGVHGTWTGLPPYLRPRARDRGHRHRGLRGARRVLGVSPPETTFDGQDVGPVSYELSALADAISNGRTTLDHIRAVKYADWLRVPGISTLTVNPLWNALHPGGP